MGTGVMGHIGNDCKFINTAWIFIKNLLNIDIDVFYLNTPRFFHDGL